MRYVLKVGINVRFAKVNSVFFIMVMIVLYIFMNIKKLRSNFINYKEYIELILTIIL
jgi:hypothetical protein